MNKRSSSGVARVPGFVAALLIAGVASPALALTGDIGSHDPSRMLESNGRVYIYSTGGGAKSSADGLDWKSEPTPPWNKALLANNEGIWARSPRQAP